MGENIMKIYKIDFLNEIKSKMIYIYKIDKPSDSEERNVYYFIYSEKDKRFNQAQDNYNKVARLIYERKVSAYSGKLARDNRGDFLDDVGFVAPYVKDGEYFLTTIRDDTTNNNLVNLFEYYNV